MGTAQETGSQVPGPLVYSTNPAYPPYDWSEDQLTFSGAAVELLELVLPRSAAAVPRVVPWKRALAMAQDGQIDLLLALRKTPERQKFLVFTTHRAFPNPIVIFARADRGLVYQKWEDLKAYRGGVSLGDTFGGGFDEYWPKNLKMETTRTMVENFEKLESGRIDYFVTGKFMGQAYLAWRRFEKPIVTVGPPISQEDIYLGFSRRSLYLSLVPLVDQKLTELDRNGFLEKLLEKYTKLYANNRTGVFP